MKGVKKMGMKYKFKGVLKDFNEFLREYKIIPLAIAFIIGMAAVALVQSVVNNLLMPILTPFIPGGGWQTSQLKLGPIYLGWGALLAAIINFVIIAFVVFLIAKFLLKEAKVSKK